MKSNHPQTFSRPSAEYRLPLRDLLVISPSALDPRIAKKGILGQKLIPGRTHR